LLHKRYAGFFLVLVLIQKTVFAQGAAPLPPASIPDELEALSFILENVSDVSLFEQNLNPRDESLKAWNTPLIQILANHLLVNNHLRSAVGETTILANSSVRVAEVDRNDEVIRARIQLILGDGDYEKTQRGYEGPRTESSILLTFPVTIERSTGEMSIDEMRGYVLFAG